MNKNFIFPLSIIIALLTITSLAIAQDEAPSDQDVVVPEASSPEDAVPEVSSPEDNIEADSEVVDTKDTEPTPAVVEPDCPVIEPKTETIVKTEVVKQPVFIFESPTPPSREVYAYPIPGGLRLRTIDLNYHMVKDGYGASFAFGRRIPLGPGTTKDHLALSLGFQLPPLFPGMSYSRNERDEHRVEMWYGVDAGVIGRINSFVEFGISVGPYVKMVAVGKSNVSSSSDLSDNLDSEADGDAMAVTGIRLNPVVNLAFPGVEWLAFSFGLDIHKDSKDFGPLGAGISVDSPDGLENINPDDITSPEDVEQLANDSDVSLNSDDQGAPRVAGSWKMVPTIGLKFRTGCVDLRTRKQKRSAKRGK